MSRQNGSPVQLSYKSQLYISCGRLHEAILARWERGAEALEDAATSGSIAFDVQEMSAEDEMSEEEQSSYYRLGYFQRFMVFLEWEISQADESLKVFPGFSVKEACLGFAQSQVQVLHWVLENEFEEFADFTVKAYGTLGLHLSAGWEAVLHVDAQSDRPVATFSQIGGVANSQRYIALRSRALELYRSRDWKSPRAAAQHIWKDIYDLSLKGDGPRLSEDRAQQTVYEWLLKANTRSGKRIRDQESA